MTSFPDRCLEVYKSFYSPTILSNKFAFITGGGSGISFRVAEAFMRHGCSVAIASRNLARVRHAANELNTHLSPKYHTKCIFFKMDITQEQQVNDTVSSILQQFPRIDILVNGAAGNFLCAIEDLSFHAFRKVMEIDTFGTFLASKACFEQSMKHSKQMCSIINLTATLHYQGSNLQCHAGCAKAANDAMMRHMANEWAQYAIRVNGVAPGGIKDTVGFDKLGGGTVKHKMFERMVPLGRVGTKKEIADVCVFLASEAAGYITGDVVIVDGGQYLKFDGFNVMGDRYFKDAKFREMVRGQKVKRKESKAKL